MESKVYAVASCGVADTSPTDLEVILDHVFAAGLRRYPALSGAIRRLPALSGACRRASALSGAFRRFPARFGALRRALVSRLYRPHA
jgi:hypothetical protein